ncbi:MAG: PAS domain-containing hybrid sensor histidine kinase/response regulator [Aquabacterium sp.]|uniref:hybrid sensor histidine kinase/response regulator n=1 Tax=Aquabacterium sp. TaxID=1872578 RepID=UPI001215BD66|nr:PAS domain-containing hybrid sensor histidine kinase/response regulator [Aquabacterium sp.]TAK96607.1 MAG: PAS domain-containing hybrid sensor histidine kinase/response regulator [Aquabacterium sp.]
MDDPADSSARTDTPTDTLVDLRAALNRVQAERDALQERLDQAQTRQSQLEKRLKARESLLKGLSQHIPGVLFKVVVPPGGEAQLHYISERAAELYELDANATGMDWSAHYQRIHPDDLPLVMQLSREIADKEGQLQHFEYRAILPKKGLRWMAGQSIAAKEGPDGSTAWYGYVQDVTEQKLYAEAVIAAQSAERANHAKSEFLSRMSHELRTPLNAIIGFAQLLQMDRSSVFGDEHRRRVNLIEKAGQHLLSMLGDVLDLSRIEAGDLPLSIAAQDIDLIADDALNMVAAQARHNQIRIDTQGVGCHVYAMADRVRLRQVLVNLLSNAIKYNRAHGLVQLRTRRAGSEVLIEVQDTGIGMNPEQLDQLFQPFNRLGVEQSGIEGTGIGLVIVHKLVTLMGGSIEIDSQAGVGTSVRILLPAADHEPEPTDQIPLSDGDLFARPATILYAEDNEVNVALVHQVIKLRPHWRLLVAMNGTRALDVARRSHPDLMLIDMHLGDMTGLDLAQALDAEDSTRDIPRVALSADAMPDRIHAARAHGFKAYLTKPLDVMALLRCLEEHLSGS